MPRYIDADALRKETEKKISNSNAYRMAVVDSDFLDLIDDAHTEDVVEVVRCKDCKYWSPMDNGISWNHIGRTDGECSRLWEIHNAERHLTKDEHFCGYGKRKESE